jgi:uncharacterized ubiquitin-like protein YukD
MKTLKTLFLSLFLAFTFSGVAQYTHEFEFNSIPGESTDVIDATVNINDVISISKNFNGGAYSIYLDESILPFDEISTGDDIFNNIIVNADLYKIEVKNNFSTFLTINITVNESTSVSENQDIKFNVYPNPFVDFINIEGEVKSISIFDLTGKLVLFDNSRSDNPTVDVSNLDSGTYLLVINDRKTIKIVK